MELDESIWNSLRYNGVWPEMCVHNGEYEWNNDILVEMRLCALFKRNTNRGSCIMCAVCAIVKGKCANKDLDLAEKVMFTSIPYYIQKY